MVKTLHYFQGLLLTLLVLEFVQQQLGRFSQLQESIYRLLAAKKYCYATHAYGVDSIECFQNEASLNEAWESVSNCAAYGEVTFGYFVAITKQYTPPLCKAIEYGLREVPFGEYVSAFLPCEADTRRAVQFLIENAPSAPVR